MIEGRMRRHMKTILARKKKLIIVIKKDIKKCRELPDRYYLHGLSKNLIYDYLKELHVIENTLEDIINLRSILFTGIKLKDIKLEKSIRNILNKKETGSKEIRGTIVRSKDKINRELSEIVELAKFSLQILESRYGEDKLTYDEYKFYTSESQDILKKLGALKQNFNTNFDKILENHYNSFKSFE